MNLKKSKYERYGVQLPELVERAVELAEKLNFPVMPKGRPVGFKGPASACIPEVGQLLRTLVASKPGGRIAEHGTGAGIGTAWMASALLSGAKLISAEIDTRLAEAAKQLFKDCPNVEIRAGDCMDVLKDEPPFDLVFMDAGARRYLAPEHWDSIVEMVKVGGQIVMDDLTPLELWPPEWDDLVDLKRKFAFHNPHVVSAEVRTTKAQVALIITRSR
jgi:predicted O-methyltransferase YrrM